MPRPAGRALDPNAFDEIAVTKLVQYGHTAFAVKPCTVDFQEAIIRLVKLGYSDGQIAYLVGKSRLSVMRIRKRRSIPPAIVRGNHNTLRVDAPTRHRSLK